ncbi:cupin domain-containing protein [Haloterrigena alkaliphila]|uniref:Cupin domain-containing protein n=1 Tax=Haloterrigena alkaliphila TaxID=2816475 RepID=A0A8A2V9T1_9EURY|nr:cupin domain-containing protein [Haloterrigena alkaliphila]QSW98789.1 cupin domain-containing protein [Haloterrigena alkaliphila]
MSDTDRSLIPTELQRLADLEATPHAQVFDEPKTVRLRLEAGEGVPAHRHPGREIVCHVLEGRLTIALGDDEREVAAGEVVRFDGEQEIAPTAQVDSTALLVLAPRAD